MNLRTARKIDSIILLRLRPYRRLKYKRSTIIKAHKKMVSFYLKRTAHYRYLLSLETIALWELSNAEEESTSKEKETKEE